MSTTQSERLRGLLEPLVSKRGLDLEEIEVTPAGKRRVLRVVVDADDGVQLDTCADLSRALSEVLDESDAMGGSPYVLEVTSPGADRPLTEQRHYRRAVGRLIKAQLTEEAGGGEVTARLMAVDDEGVDLEIPGVKGRKPTSRRLAFGEIAKARVEIEFNRKAAEKAQHGSAATDQENKEEA
ncbi:MULTISPECIES: ribosome maturation factor RimP [unclassified Streptomyces]|uniref:ribosome maturation factor RimP n=1 Tax=unclassified Streptomyces TaxID=2593676 RepID=UPI002DD9389A|nr:MULTISPECIES: ribosome maturation factor RimP [unclassified Streptomyces]WSA92050.1 ribosome maturation factor RimP [Streptomyces sp. NBC_01795]WSB76416.1 ribosome maturation factor RimP [Streptomyces sp. NBC_01775]WSS15309.1 ribosome maturation factor RimP [Streptomyces sp. NBC_01186]WSS44153.1 ribosome maturation factor RimP [Streptomyces sp. NBC_01187]